VKSDSVGVLEFEISREETYENDAGIQTQIVSGVGVEMPLWVPVILDWSAIASHMQAFFALSTGETAGQNVYTSVSDVINAPAVQVIDNTQYITTVVMKREATMFLVGALTNFAGVSVYVHACPCIGCDAGFVKTVVGNQCACAHVENGVCVECVNNDNTYLSCHRCNRGQFSTLVKASTTCEDCVAGTYSTQALATCTPCPQHSFTHGSQEVSADACHCNAGYYKTDTCEECPANFFKPTIGNFDCTMCPAPLVGELTTQTSDAACVSCPGTSFYDAADGTAQCTLCDALGCECPVGFTGDGKVECVQCAQGTWKSIVGSMACTECPPGYIGHETDRLAQDTACVQCGTNTYAQAQTCVPCVTGTAAPAGSDHISDCIVQPGYELDTSGIPASILQFLLAQNLVPVRSCVPGTFKNIAGNSACVACEDGKYQPDSAQLSCLTCPLNTVQIAGADRSLLESCVCAAGYVRVGALTTLDSGCAACSVGKFTEVPDSDVCQGCSSGKYFAASGTAHSNNQCLACPPDSHSTSNAVLISSCLCNSGYERVSDNCHACNNNETEIAGTCVACPSHSAHAFLASAKITDCVCVGGYKGDNGTACVQCQENVWCYMGQEYNCPNDRSTRGLTTRASSADCYCALGYYAFDGNCVPCAVNSYCDFDQLNVCPTNSISSKYSSSKSACQCVAGYKKNFNAGGEFVACIECHAKEVCLPAQFSHTISIDSDASIPQLSEVKNAINVMIQNQEYYIRTILTRVQKKTKFPATRVLISQDIITNVKNTATLADPAIVVVNTTLQNSVEINISFSNIAPATASQAIRGTIAEHNKLQTFLSTDIDNWINVSTKADFVPSTSSPATFRRRNLLAVIVPYSAPSPPPPSPISISSDSVTILSAYAATVQVNVTAIIQAHEQKATVGFVAKLDSVEIENYINQLFHSQTRRLLAFGDTTSESSATVDSMRLDTTMETVYDSGSDTMTSADALQESQNAMVEQLSTATNTDDVFASTETTTETTIAFDTSTAEESVKTLFDGKNTKTVYNIEKTAVSISASASMVSCVTDASVVNSVCYCDVGMYCSNLLATDEAGCTTDKGTLSCEPCALNHFCTGNNYARHCGSNFATISEKTSEQNNCLCNAGYFKSADNEVCLPCGFGAAEDLVHHYCPFNADKQECDFTLNFDQASELASSSLDCMCKAGYFRMNNLDTCKPCPLHHFCPTVPSNAGNLPNIQSCPLNMLTEGIASATQSSCVCRVGFKAEMDDVSTTCLACGIDELCSLGTQSDSSIMCEVDKQASDDHSVCICKPGYHTSSVLQGVHFCTPCEAGKIQVKPGQFECTACGPGFFAQNANQACVACINENEEALSEANAMCRCRAPYIQGSSECVLCPIGKYFEKDTTNSATHAGTCQSCPEASQGITQAQIAGLDVCVCNAGYARAIAPADATKLCTVCPGNTFEYNDVCVDCGGEHASSPAGSSSFDACNCDADTKRLWAYFDDVLQIPPCVQGIDEVNTLQCTACAPGTYSNTIARDSQCIDCPIGKYQYEAGKSACEACADLRNTLAPASIDAGACVCNAGYSLKICDDLLTSCGSSCGTCAGSFCD